MDAHRNNNNRSSVLNLAKRSIAFSWQIMSGNYNYRHIVELTTSYASNASIVCAISHQQMSMFNRRTTNSNEANGQNEWNLFQFIIIITNSIKCYLFIVIGVGSECSVCVISVRVVCACALVWVCVLSTIFHYVLASQSLNHKSYFYISIRTMRGAEPPHFGTHIKCWASPMHVCHAYSIRHMLPLTAKWASNAHWNFIAFAIHSSSYP